MNNDLIDAQRYAKRYRECMERIAETSKLSGNITEGYYISDRTNGYCDTDMAAENRMLKQKLREKDMDCRLLVRDMKKQDRELHNLRRSIRDARWTIDIRIEKVVFNNPATIVWWSDGVKTVVKAQDEPFDEEKGLAMAIAKRVLGNKGNYFNEIKKWLPEIEVKKEEVPEKFMNPPINGRNEFKMEAYSLDNPGKTKCKGECNKCCPAQTGSVKNIGKNCRECSACLNRF